MCSSQIYELLSFDAPRLSQASLIGEHLRHLRQKFSERTDTIKEKIHRSTDYDHDGTGCFNLT